MNSPVVVDPAFFVNIDCAPGLAFVFNLQTLPLSKQQHMYKMLKLLLKNNMPQKRILKKWLIEDFIAEHCIGIRAANLLRDNFKTVGDLVKLTLNEFMNIRNMGMKSVWEIKDAMNNANLHFRPGKGKGEWNPGLKIHEREALMKTTRKKTATK